MDPGFPRLIQADWTGIPQRVDAAFKLEGKRERIKRSRRLVSVDSGILNQRGATEIEVCNFFVCEFVECGWGLPLMEHFYTSNVAFWSLALTLSFGFLSYCFDRQHLPHQCGQILPV